MTRTASCSTVSLVNVEDDAPVCIATIWPSSRIASFMSRTRNLPATSHHSVGTRSWPQLLLGVCRLCITDNALETLHKFTAKPKRGKVCNHLSCHSSVSLQPTAVSCMLVFRHHNHSITIHSLVCTHQATQLHRCFLSKIVPHRPMINQLFYDHWAFCPSIIFLKVLLFCFWSLPEIIPLLVLASIWCKCPSI